MSKREAKRIDKALRRIEAEKLRPVPTLIKGTLHVFTDGSCDRKSRQGGWGVVLRWADDTRHLYGGSSDQTNNTMELTAIHEALKARTRDVSTIVYSDSQYSIHAVTLWHHAWRKRGWITATGTPVRNVELIEGIISLITPNVRFQWVRGHNGHFYNEAADRLASRGRKEFGSCQTPQSVTITAPTSQD